MARTAFENIDLTQLEAPPAIAAIRRICDGFKAFQVLRAGYDSGLFDWLEQNGPAERAVIADALKLRGAHLSGFLQALEDLGLVVKEKTFYSLAPDMIEVLSGASPWRQADEVKSLLDPSCGWSDLRGFISEGWKPEARQTPLPLKLHPFLGEARRLSAYLVSRAGQRSSGSVRMLCYDGGDGLFTAAFCQYSPKTRATIVVAPDALGRAEEIIAACGLAGRCRVLPGTPLDQLANTPLASFDRVVLFHSLYSVRKSSADALAKAASYLAPGGELCCAHWFCLEACETAPGGLRDLDKAVITDSHPLCHIEEFCQRLEAAGLSNAERDDLASELGNTKLHFASRAGSCC